MGDAGRAEPWAYRIVDWAAEQPVPDRTRYAAARQVLDAVACALGAVGHEATEAVLGVVRELGGNGASGLLFGAGRTSIPNAILYNASLVRALDCNDIFFDDGPAGHPSDTIAAALAAAEAADASGRELLDAVVVGYELYFRILHVLRVRSSFAKFWDSVFASTIATAVMVGRLLRLDRDASAHAVAIACAQSYSLRQIRRGQIGMVKASASAMTEQSAAMAVLLARAGMTGPLQVFEGVRGLFAAAGVSVTDEVIGELVAPVEEWRIHQVTTKVFPAIGTSQGAIAAALDIVHASPLDIAAVTSIEVRLPDLPVTREHMDLVELLTPETRESADHSVPFVVAVALADGAFGPAQFREGRWRDDDVRRLMGLVRQVPDGTLNEGVAALHPAVVSVATADGGILRREIAVPPGSPGNPPSDEQIAEKLRRFAPEGLPPDHLDGAVAALLGLDGAERVGEVLRALDVLAP